MNGFTFDTCSNLAQTLPFSLVMTFFDLIIIYLACGAPFGVYYFLHYRKRSFSRQIWIKSILAFLFWIPFAYRLLRNGKIRRKLFNLGFNSNTFTESQPEKQLFLLQHRIEKFSLESRSPISIFEIREVFDRYCGLTLAIQNVGENFNEKNENAAALFRIAERENVKLGAICLQRRNQKRLEFHQTQASKDFLKLIGHLSRITDQTDILRKLSIQFVELLKDEKTVIEIEKLFSSSLQTDKKLPVKESEKDLWKPEIQKPQPTAQLSINTMNLRARTNSFSKD